MCSMRDIRWVMPPGFLQLPKIKHREELAGPPDLSDLERTKVFLFGELVT
jgi:hypothetical protein